MKKLSDAQRRLLSDLLAGPRYTRAREGKTVWILVELGLVARSPGDWHRISLTPSGLEEATAGITEVTR